MNLNTSLHNEQELLRKISKGDHHAFRIVYEKYRKKVYSVALQILKSNDLAEEVMQETMLKLWQVAGTLADDTVLDAYLRTITRNRSFNILRRQILEAKVAVEMGRDWTELHDETEEKILLDDTRKVLEAAIEQLPPQQKLVYQLCQQQGLKYEEAALQLNLSTLTVQSYMKLALRFVRKYVSQHTDIAAVLIIFKIL